jgi:hypothetical protein
MLAPGLAYIAETSGKRKYWDVAMEGFERQTEAAEITDKLKLFAQLFRNSQRFLWYLSVECTALWTAGDAVAPLASARRPFLAAAAGYL